ncbi:peptidoglycan D,D-transpeptidase FtsI family protein [Fructilactobacillus frigidiflavus]|uniref:peptidoglycan D,D-transpeptidase FtsI family protein n=1 Tax=Fructilactobacillus frigidiflavus TaxID=3242688 RepID=UPI0037570F11
MGNFFGKFFKKRTRSTRQANESNTIPFRLNLIFLVVGLLFIILIWKLADLQIIQGNYFKSTVNQSNNYVKYGNVPRGMIYDSTGKLMVGNESQRAITYTRLPSVTSKDIYQTATQLGEYITVPTNKLTKKQIAEYYLASPSNQKAAEKKISGAANMDPDELQKAEINKFVAGEITPVTDKMKNAAAIFNSMSGAYTLSTTYIKYNHVSAKELSLVGEHQSELPGVEVGNNWVRNYPQGKEVQTVTGSVSSNKSGLPEDRVNSLLAQGYSQNEFVGTSDLESQYEPVLKGSKSQTKVKVNSSNQIVSQVVKYPGQSGDNLQLTINSKFQNDLQKIVRKNQAGGYSTGTYAVVMNPHTGGIIGMAGVDRDPKTNKVTQNDMGVINRPITMGSVVKPAMESGALMKGIITPENSVQTDQPIKNGGGVKSSWFNTNGSHNIQLTAQDALEVSSNSYMMQLAMKEAGYKYVPGAALNMNPSIFDTLRNNFKQFGLGVKTGIDLPGESAGIEGPTGFANIGKALDESYGNYDGYTTIQLAQYVATIANGGYRLKPQLVQNIRGSNKDNNKLGAIKETVRPKILNQIPMTEAQRNVILQGMYQVVHGHSPYRTGELMNTVKPEIAAKTGTAQTFYDGNQTTTLSLIAMAPAKDPKVVVALAMPNMPAESGGNNGQLATDILNAYWKDVEKAPK